MYRPCACCIHVGYFLACIVVILLRWHSRKVKQGGTQNYCTDFLLRDSLEQLEHMNRVKPFVTWIITSQISYIMILIPEDN